MAIYGIWPFIKYLYHNIGNLIPTDGITRNAQLYFAENLEVN
jgi:hypothetical protein